MAILAECYKLDELRMAMARGYCSKSNEHKELDSVLIEAMVDELQNNPDDQALREKIIKLALNMKPKPAIPDEAKDLMARGKAYVAEAKGPQDYAKAVD